MAPTLDQHLSVHHHRGATGTLHVRDANGRSHRIHLRLGMVQAVELDAPGLRFGDVLAESLPLPSSLLNYAEGITRARDRRLGELLVTAGLISPRQRDATLERQRILRLARIATSGIADTTFDDPLPLPSGAWELSPLPVGVWGHPRGRALKVLELGLGASQDEVVTAYRRLARTLHPDRTGNACTEAFRAVVDAYRLLSSASPVS